MPEPRWPITGPLNAIAFQAAIHHARLAAAQSLGAIDLQLQKTYCPTEPYLLANLVVAVLTGAGYNDLLEKHGADAARFWLHHAFGSAAQEIERLTGHRVKINFDVRETPSDGT